MKTAETSGLKVGSKKVGGKKIGGKKVGNKKASSKEAGNKKLNGFLVDFTIALLWYFAKSNKKYFSIYFLKLYQLQA